MKSDPVGSLYCAAFEEWINISCFKGGETNSEKNCSLGETFFFVVVNINIVFLRPLEGLCHYVPFLFRMKNFLELLICCG